MIKQMPNLQPVYAAQIAYWQHPCWENFYAVDSALDKLYLEALQLGQEINLTNLPHKENTDNAYQDAYKKFAAAYGEAGQDIIMSRLRLFQDTFCGEKTIAKIMLQFKRSNPLVRCGFFFGCLYQADNQEITSLEDQILYLLDTYNMKLTYLKILAAARSPTAEANAEVNETISAIIQSFSDLLQAIQNTNLQNISVQMVSDFLRDSLNKMDPAQYPPPNLMLRRRSTRSTC